ncbi:glucokinase [Neptunicella marina]|uniref:Glucokinase n=1 Tax=Neptunicella marina TaxID=2125989 RepID=A0A8J6IQF8_9ALTE|nr:glucokinase [Neptunicella marina]MBC3764579.1 glucokinase [Neptunicella marina]
MSERFVADVGGTNIRLAREVNGKLADIKKYLCKDFADIADVIKLYCDSLPEYHFVAGCIAIACPVNGDFIKMTNHDWQFSIEITRKQLGLEHLLVINDYTAISMSLPVLNDEQKVKIGGGEPTEGQPMAVFGAGTGLGVGHLIPVTEGWKPIPGEGGHVDFAPIDDTDLAIWQYLRKKHGHVSAEQLISGPGLLQIYHALAALNQVTPTCASPAEVTEQALSGNCAVCEQTLTQFCKVMGSFAGNIALNMGTFGGVYIAGGIAQRFVDFVLNSEFRARFEDKGRFKPYMQAIPVYLITEADHGLMGAAAYLEQNLKEVS